jgi:hypothetical protein
MSEELTHLAARVPNRQLVLRWLGAAALVGCLVVVALESWLNGAEDPFTEIRLDDTNSYAQSVCELVRAQFVAPRAASATPCTISDEIAHFLRGIEKRDRVGYSERLEWDCNGGGSIAVMVRAGVNWTGLCVRCRSSRARADCSL